MRRALIDRIEPIPRGVAAASVEPDAEELVARIRAGDVAAFERLYRAQHAPLCAFVVRYVSAPDRAAELVQTIFAQLWQQRARLQVATTIERYLFGAARNAAVHAVRHELVERRWRERMATELGDDEQRRSTANTAETSLDARDVAAAVRRALTGLPPRCVTAFMLRWQRQLSYAEIAEVMGVSANTVDVYLTRANLVLREAKESLRALR